MWFASAATTAFRCEPLLIDLDGPKQSELELELMSFITSLNNLRRGSRRVLGHDAKHLKQFDDAVPDLKDIRDQLEHFDDYINGTGKLQKGVSPDLENFWQVGHSGGRVQIGDRTAIRAHFQIFWGTRTFEVDLVSSLMAAERLVAEVLDACHYTPNPTAIMLAATGWCGRHQVASHPPASKRTH